MTSTTLEENYIPCKTTDEAIERTQQELNGCLVAFNTWASRNPKKLIICTNKNDKLYPLGEEFRQWKQKIKLLKLKLRNLHIMKEQHQHK